MILDVLVCLVRQCRAIPNLKGDENILAQTAQRWYFVDWKATDRYYSELSEL